MMINNIIPFFIIITMCMKKNNFLNDLKNLLKYNIDN